MSEYRFLRWQFWIAATVLAGGLGCTAEKQQVPPPQEAVRNVSTVVVQRASIPDFVEAVGTVRAAETSQLASQMMGTIVSVAVHEGDIVRRGQVLAVIDDAQARAALNRANAGVTASANDVAAVESDFALASATLRRYQSLYERKSVSPQEFDEVKARVANAEARRDAAKANQSGAKAAVAQAQTTLEYSKIRAPFDGVVTAKLADAGSLASPGMPLLTVENPSRFRLEATVDESQIGVVQLGASVNVVIEALAGQAIAGKVSQIIPAAESASRTFTVKVDLPATPGVRSGLFGRAQFARAPREGISIPAASLVQRGQLQGVFVVGKDNVANLRFITMGKRSGDSFEVLSGLEPGERLVQSVDGRDLAGRKIEVR